jgi:hypothetical protein
MDFGICCEDPQPSEFVSLAFQLRTHSARGISLIGRLDKVLIGPIGPHFSLGLDAVCPITPLLRSRERSAEGLLDYFRIADYSGVKSLGSI